MKDTSDVKWWLQFACFWLVVIGLMFACSRSASKKQHTKEEERKIEKQQERQAKLEDMYLYKDQCDTYHISLDCYEINECKEVWSNGDEEYELKGSGSGVLRVSKDSIINDGFGEKYYICRECIDNELYDALYNEYHRIGLNLDENEFLNFLNGK